MVRSPFGSHETVSMHLSPELDQIKPVFDVESLEAALERVNEKGGVVTGRTFSIDGLTRHDVIDPDVNVL